MLKRICQSCGRIIQQGKECPCHSPGERRRVESFYSSGIWKRIAKAARQRAGYVDEYVRAYEGRIIVGRFVHHIYTIDERPNQMLSLDNLVVVSNKTHEMIHAAYHKGGEEKKIMQGRLLSIRKHDI